MAGILQTSGPISTCEAIRYTWKFLKSTTVTQYQAAAVELEKLNLGSFVTFRTSVAGPYSKVFIKKLPEEARECLVAHHQLCHPDTYARRFHRPSPKSIVEKVKAKCVELGLVAEELFK